MKQQINTRIVNGGDSSNLARCIHHKHIALHCQECINIIRGLQRDNAVKSLPDQLVDYLRSNWCMECGCADPTCQCWNDD